MLVRLPIDALHSAAEGGTSQIVRDFVAPANDAVLRDREIARILKSSVVLLKNYLNSEQCTQNKHSLNRESVKTYLKIEPLQGFSRVVDDIHASLIHALNQGGLRLRAHRHAALRGTLRSLAIALTVRTVAQIRRRTRILQRSQLQQVVGGIDRVRGLGSAAEARALARRGGNARRAVRRLAQVGGADDGRVDGGGDTFWLLCLKLLGRTATLHPKHARPSSMRRRSQTIPTDPNSSQLHSRTIRTPSINANTLQGTPPGVRSRSSRD